MYVAVRKSPRALVSARRTARASATLPTNQVLLYAVPYYETTTAVLRVQQYQYTTTEQYVVVAAAVRSSSSSSNRVHGGTAGLHQDKPQTKRPLLYRSTCEYWYKQYAKESNHNEGQSSGIWAVYRAVVVGKRGQIIEAKFTYHTLSPGQDWRSNGTRPPPRPSRAGASCRAPLPPAGKHPQQQQQRLDLRHPLDTYQRKVRGTRAETPVPPSPRPLRLQAPSRVSALTRLTGGSPVGRYTRARPLPLTGRKGAKRGLCLCLIPGTRAINRRLRSRSYDSLNNTLAHRQVGDTQSCRSPAPTEATEHFAQLGRASSARRFFILPPRGRLCVCASASVCVLLCLRECLQKTQKGK